MRILLVALFSFLLSGCGVIECTIPAAPEVVAYSCSESLMPACEKALAVWKPALEGTNWVLILGDGGARHYDVYEVASNEEDCSSGSAGTWAGCRRSEAIEVHPESWHGTADPDSVLLLVLIHEIGHTMWIGHGGTEDGVMFPSLHTYNEACIDEWTAEQIGGLATCRKSGPQESPAVQPSTQGIAPIQW